MAIAYGRYMGDLSGGQSLQNIAQSAMNLPPDQGTKLHEFDAAPTVEARRAFKIRYRDAPNSLPMLFKTSAFYQCKPFPIRLFSTRSY